LSVHTVNRQQCQRLVDGGRDAGGDRVRRGQHRFHDRRIELKARQPGQHGSGTGSV
jgi:hypothetical protein